MASENTKRIAKNSAVLYIRMAVVMLISILTARIVLETLGVDDYGVYNVVSGVIVMFSFISTSLSSATSRFITFALGKGDFEKLRTTFSTGLIAMTCIGFVIVLLGETIGLWFLENKLVIPEKSMFAARVVYQFSIISTFLGLTQVPYSACITAHEKMNVYAYFEIINIVLRLLIIYLLVIVDTNKLILYGALGFCVSVIMMAVNRIYCLRHFKESHFKWIIEKPLLKKMLSYSGWDLFGNCSHIVRTTGLSMLVNMFFGVAANAAIGIATAIQGAVSSFTSNLMTATKPQIIKSYASGDYDYMIMLIMSLSRIVFLILLMLAIPLFFEMGFILKKWLVDVPTYATGLSCLTIAYLFFSTLSNIAVGGVHAIGDLRRCSLLNGSIYMTVLPISYVAFKWFDGSVYLPYALNATFVLIGCLVNIYTIHLYVKQMSVFKYIYSVLLRCLLVGGVTVFVCFIIVTNVTDGWFRVMAVSMASFIITTFLGYYLALDNYERTFVKNAWRKIRSRVCVKFHNS